MLLGKDEEGRFKTAPKKRYPREMCSDISASIIDFLELSWKHAVPEENNLAEELAHLFVALGLT